MTQSRSYFREAIGKTVEQIVVANTRGYRAVNIQFTDQTTLKLVFETHLKIHAELQDWSSGDAASLVKYETIPENG